MFFTIVDRSDPLPVLVLIIFERSNLVSIVKNLQDNIVDV